MNPSSRKLIARLILGLGVFSACVWLTRLDYTRHISLDVLDLVPADEREPELAMVRKLAGEEQGRILLFALDASQDDVRVERFIDTLQDSAAMAEVVRMGDSNMRDSLGAYVFEHRFELLLPAWLAERASDYEMADRPTPWPEWLAARAAEDLEAFLGTAEALAFEQLLEADPLLLVSSLAHRLGGLNTATSNDPSKVLVWARGSDSPLKPEAQQALFTTINDAQKQLGSENGDPGLAWTGVARFAAQSREKITSEVTRLNVLSLLAVLAVAAMCLRQAHKILHVIPVVVCSLLGAWTATTFFVPRVHVLVLVVGALLCGIAIDYALHVYLHPLREGDDFSRRLRAVMKPLLVGAFTTAIGFSFLLLAELPFIRHLGVFVTTGLICAVASAILWFSQIGEPHAETRAATETPFRWMRSRAFAENGRMKPGAVIILPVALAIALLGPWFVRWHDDIRELEPPAPDLYANDRALRALFGETHEHTTYLTRGNSVAEARDTLQRFLAWHNEQFPNAQTTSLGLVLPAQARYARLPDDLRELEGFPDAFRRELVARDFDPDHFGSFFAKWRRMLDKSDWPDYDTLVADLSSNIRGPLSVMMSMRAGSSWFATMTDSQADGNPPVELATVNANQLHTLNDLFRRYRHSVLRLSLIGFGVAALGIVVIYGPRKTLRILLLPAGACLFTFGLFGLTGQTLNIFHLLGAFLGVCLSFDYAVFAMDSATRNQPPPVSIRLSAATTAASFGVLATSSIPVVAALGITVSIIVLTALLWVEITPRKSRKVAESVPRLQSSQGNRAER